MKANIIELMTVFDEFIEEYSNNELGVYWFKTRRKDGLTVTVSFSIHENYFSLIVYTSFNVTTINLRMNYCSEIRVLDEKKKCLEVVHEPPGSRCFIALDSDTIVTYDEPPMELK